MSAIPDNLQAVRGRIAAAAQDAARAPQSVALLAVSKTFSAADVLEAIRAGQRAFGESYVQEAVEKMAEVRRQLEAGGMAAWEELEWHFIGPVQSNKTAQISRHFQWVHSVEREKIAERLSNQRPAEMGPLNICLQVNISGEASKSGVRIEAAGELARKIAALPNLRLRGLMAIPEPATTLEEQRAPFRRMRELFDAINRDGLRLDVLSMGMTDDMQAAILEGATLVRIGTAIFGKRDYAK